MSKEKPMDDFEGLNESEKLQAEYILLDKAFRTSFDIIIGKTTLKFVLKETEGVILAHDPESPLDTERNMYSLQNMMDYFVEEEEYEKCAKVRDIINLFINKDTTNQEEEEDKL
jgi:hypothetical protein